jgi:hypothetical protein
MPYGLEAEQEAGHLKFLRAPPLAWHLTPKSLVI